MTNERLADYQLRELAEDAATLRLPGDGSFGDIARRLMVANDVLEQVPALVEELREARRRLAEVAPEPLAW